ncbi:spore germination protein [Bacillus sp. WLY-B-L8]|uniref:spore germination protein n=1 Tax=Bacillus multifaciens TaxID=3068506 RepID=UPI002741257A|nr:spore germination protein [Bacillus sp. WLY-B-L8]MDP7978992.1 spore germination protein [Bacillus sp. WLY-B-L8]
MNSLIRKIKIINNKGAINMGNCYDLSPFVATKVFSGAGGSSAATFLNGKLTPPRAPQGTEFIPPLEESSTAGV